MYTGIRRFELYQLLSTDIESNSIKLIGKNRRFRLIPINDSIEKLIEELKSEWVWKSLKSINNHFMALNKKVGFQVNPHRYRASFATKLINNGIDLVTIQTLMGHSSVNTTAEYIKINTVKLSAAVEQLTNPSYDLDGMTIDEMKAEIIKLRFRINRKEDQHE